MTPRQKEVRDFMLNFGRMYGRWATVSEAADHFQISKAGVQHHLAALERQGAVRQERPYSHWELTGYRFTLTSK